MLDEIILNNPDPSDKWSNVDCLIVAYAMNHQESLYSRYYHTIRDLMLAGF